MTSILSLTLPAEPVNKSWTQAKRNYCRTSLCPGIYLGESIQTALGRAGGDGLPRTNLSGCAMYASCRTLLRDAITHPSKPVVHPRGSQHPDTRPTARGGGLCVPGRHAPFHSETPPPIFGTPCSIGTSARSNNRVSTSAAYLSRPHSSTVIYPAPRVQLL